MRVEIDGQIFELPDDVTEREILQMFGKENDEKGALDAAMISAGYAVDKLGSGIQELYYDWTGNDEALGQLKAEMDAKADYMQPLQQSHPVASFAGEMLPAFAIPGGAVAKTVGKVASKIPALAKVAPRIAQSGLVDAMGSGALYGAAEYGTDAADAALWGGAGHLAGRALFGGKSLLSRPEMEVAEEAGFKLTPGQRTGNRALQQLEASMASSPFTSRPFNKIKEHNQTVINRAAGKSIGANADKLTDDVLSDNLARMESVFDDIRNVPDIRTASIQDDLVNIVDEFDGLTTQKVEDNVLIKQLDRIAMRGNVTGREARALQSKIGTAARNQMTTPGGDRELGIALFRAKDSLDSAISGSLTGEQRAAFNRARKEYANFMDLMKSVNTVNDSGDVAAQTLRNTKKRKNAKAYIRGDDELTNVLKTANRFRDVVGDSGTAARLSLPLLGLATAGAGQTLDMDYLTNLGLAMVGGSAAGRYYTNGPMRAGLLGTIGKLPDNWADELTRLMSRAAIGAQ